MIKGTVLSLSVLGCVILAGCLKEAGRDNLHLAYAKETLDSVYSHYSVEETKLLRENHPFDEDYMATYLASEEQAAGINPYAYLWPFSGTFSAVSAIMELDGSYRALLDGTVLPALEEYFDTLRTPAAYASYINSAPVSDRFYDDNVWVGIDFTDVYVQTGDRRYLDRAELLWEFIESGIDDALGGGIYWCEQKKRGKNTCSNAPGAVYALKLYRATGNAHYLDRGRTLYEWTKAKLQDPEDGLYFDNIRLDGRIDRTKYAYNSGQMIQAGVLLYRITGEGKYLDDARRVAEGSYKHFFHDFVPVDGPAFRLINKGNVWFSAVMFRGFADLYETDGNPEYISAFARSLDYAWEHSRDTESGLFSADWSGEEYDGKKWLLTQAAMAEMYARLAILDFRSE